MLATALLTGFLLGRALPVPAEEPVAIKTPCIEGVMFFELWQDDLGRSTFMGEMVVCGDLLLSGAYGPSLDYWIEKGMRFDGVQPTPISTPDWISRDPRGP